MLDQSPMREGTDIAQCQSITSNKSQEHSSPSYIAMGRNSLYTSSAPELSAQSKDVRSIALDVADRQQLSIHPKHVTEDKV